MSSPNSLARRDAKRSKVAQRSGLSAGLVGGGQLNRPRKWVKSGQTSLLICGPKNGHTCPVELKDGRISNQFSALEGSSLRFAAHCG